jgi:endonuclease/exonuclease/phosphatase family metal-dependent hydrolase
MSDDGAFRAATRGLRVTVNLHEAAAKGRRLARAAARRRQPDPTASSTPPSLAPPSLTPGIVVATYNIHSCVGVDRRYDPLRVASVLRELGADVIGLQEVEVRRNGARVVDQAAFLAAAAGLRVITGQQIRLHRGRFTNALLTRLPVRAIRHIDLSVDGHEPRSAIDVDLDAGDRVVRVIATHFGLGVRERRQQTQRLLATLATDGNGGGDGILMMGDLNEWRGRRGGIPALDRELGRTPAPRTFPSWCPILPLDRIYAATPAVLREFAVHRSPLARLASDHLPLRASLAWPLPGEIVAAHDPALPRPGKTLSSRLRRNRPG